MKALLLEQQVELHLKSTFSKKESHETGAHERIQMVQTELHRSHLKGSYISNTDDIGTFSEHFLQPSRPC